MVSAITYGCNDYNLYYPTTGQPRNVYHRSALEVSSSPNYSSKGRQHVERRQEIYRRRPQHGVVDESSRELRRTHSCDSDWDMLVVNLENDDGNAMVDDDTTMDDEEKHERFFRGSIGQDLGLLVNAFRRHASVDTSPVKQLLHNTKDELFGNHHRDQLHDSPVSIVPKVEAFCAVAMETVMGQARRGLEHDSLIYRRNNNNHSHSSTSMEVCEDNDYV